MRLVVSLLGVVLSLGVMIVSGVVNARYSMSLAAKGLDRYA